ncbi:dicarboxylate/amino acid:cation symporter [Spiroplasma turonicum]|uniref:L-cystine uptake protein TcyP n=1 Tax=Spiroplasma turonicum TaxID=216946 RepID=A0A0K1P5I5_9MOLU|nr:dicarboxylate/amino acid:cation symporter [Spiroplasma turonicum]AKU79571.1 proton/glutamate symporter [Spiroplasma turonicum]ALX70594.1 proton/glutamate symporter [Spiroplasma turonicum]
MILNDNKNDILRDFIAISKWQSGVAILIFILLQIGFWVFLKKIKIAFMYRVIIGMLLGLAFGVVIQSIIGFPNKETLENSFKNSESDLYWVNELNIWSGFFKNIFIRGVLLLTIPIVFIAIFKITAKPGETGLARITAKGIAILLINVAVMFSITFFLGLATKVGQGVLGDPGESTRVKDNVPLPEIIWEYLPQNFFSALVQNSIIPVMVIAALAGMSVKILSKRNKVEMEAIVKGADTAWKITSSMLSTFMKIMPLAVMSMLSTSITSRPIGELANIGKVIGIGYLAIAIAIAWLTLQIFLSRIKIGSWWKEAWRPLIQGFATQSSNATLPVSMETLTKMKVNEKVVSSIPPISTTMGLIACAGIQSGLATSILWTGSDTVHSMGLFTFFITSLFVTIVASLGIAGVPGTASVVTIGVIGGIGFGEFIDAVLNVIAPLDGLFDMGRTGANVLAGVSTATIVAKSEGLIEEGSNLLTTKGIEQQKTLLFFKTIKDDKVNKVRLLKKELSKDLKQKDLNNEDKSKMRYDTLQKIKSVKIDYIEKKKEYMNQKKVSES